jgi:probable phosphomutase (TIGR03848 family)
MPTFLLIRHGENDFVGRGLAGRLPDVHLNEKGRRQALDLACSLAKAPIKAVYSSPLERAVETASPLAQALNLPIHIRPGLIEVNYGEWTGKPFKQLRRLKSWKQVLDNPDEMRFPQGESFVELQNRVCEEIDSIAGLHAREDLVACYTHGDVIRLAIAYYLNMPLKDFQRLLIDTASISVLYLHEGHPKVIRYNQILGFEWPSARKNHARKPLDKKEETSKFA